MGASGRRTELYGEVGSLALPVGLVSLDDLVVRAVSKLAAERIGLSLQEIVGRTVAELTHPDDVADAIRALENLRLGVIDLFRTSRRLRPAERGLTVAWVRRLDFAGESLAMFEVSVDDPAPTGPLAGYLGYEPSALAIGTVDREWRIRSVSADIGPILGADPAEYPGRVLLGGVRRQEVDLLLEAGRRSADRWSAGIRVHLRNVAGGWQQFCLVLTPMSDPEERLFVLALEHESAASERERANRLEALLWHIAGEIEASGVLQRMAGAPAIAYLPEARSLSARQWEVLSRLARGERVPTIAAALSVSQSTIRNHVSAILSRFGVKSQPELLALLRGKDVLSG